MSFALSSAAAASVARVSSRASTRSLRARKAAARPVRAMAAKAEVNQLSDGDKKPLVDSVETFIFDCDGVIWKGDSLIDGVPAVLEMLRKAGKKIFFVTNNSTKSRKGYKGKFTSLGLEVEPEEIFSSSFAAAAYLEQTNFKASGKKVAVLILKMKATARR